MLTPHPGEFARLAGAAADGRGGGAGRAGRGALPARLVGQHRRLLKGHETVICDGRRFAVNRTGNPGMATGGTGDCLTGVVAALLAQGLDAWDAARLAAHVHGTGRRSGGGGAGAGLADRQRSARLPAAGVLG